MSASPEEISAAYRRKARVLHPDVPNTGNTDAFVAVKQAYDVVGNAHARADYDRLARRQAVEAIEPGELPPPRSYNIQDGPTRAPRAADVPKAVWVVLGTVLVVGIYEVVQHLTMLPPLPPRVEIRPNAPVVAPATAEAQRLATYGPKPVRMPGVPNYYVVPGAGTTVIWRRDEARNAYVSSGQLPPFSAIQALRLFRQNGLVEFKTGDTATAFVEASRLAPGDLGTARRAYCAYNAGPAPGNGEILRQTGTGRGHLELDNRTTQPAVVKLRDAAGTVVLSTYLAPGSHVDLDGIPEGRYRPDFAIGELWSRACNGFAAGMRAQRLGGLFSLDALTPLSIPPDLPGEPAPADIPDLAFERDEKG